MHRRPGLPGAGAGRNAAAAHSVSPGVSCGPADTESAGARRSRGPDRPGRVPGSIAPLYRNYVITPVRSGDHPALLSVRVDNLASCEALLKRNGVTTLKPDAGRLLVPPSEAAHLTLEFVQ